MHWSHVLSIAWVCLCLLVSVACFVDPDSETSLGRASFLLRRSCSRLSRHAERRLGRGRWRRIIGTVEWVRAKSHPLGPLFYLLVVYGGYFIWRQKGLRFVPSESLHRYFPSIFLPSPLPSSIPWSPVVSDLCPLHLSRVTTVVSMAACLASFAAVYFSDPGRILPSSEEKYASEYRYDGVLFVRGTPCRTCGLSSKPARSKHCRICNRCVPKSVGESDRVLSPLLSSSSPPKTLVFFLQDGSPLYIPEQRHLGPKPSLVHHLSPLACLVLYLCEFHPDLESFRDL